MGFDSFGLPAENYAIKNKIHPEIAVKNNVKNSRVSSGLSVLITTGTGKLSPPIRVFTNGRNGYF